MAYRSDVPLRLRIETCKAFNALRIRAGLIGWYVESLAQVLQTAEGRVADSNMSAHPSRLPVIDGTDFQIVLVGAGAGFDLPEMSRGALASYAGRLPGAGSHARIAP